MQRIIYLFLLFLISSPIISQNFWRQIPSESIIEFRNDDTQVLPQKFSSFLLDEVSFFNQLMEAPKEFGSDKESFIIELPMPDGSFRLFRTFYSPSMEEALATKYPTIRSFKAFALDNKNINARFDLSPKGLRASISGESSIYIDPISSSLGKSHIVYYTKDYKEDISAQVLSCGMDPIDILNEDLAEEEDLDPFPLADQEISLRSVEECDSVPLYTYRFALSCTGEWANAHGGTTESVLADMVTAVNRLNQIYENEFAVRLILVAENDKLIWLDPETDPFPVADVGYQLLNINNSVINNHIGNDAFDIGHVFTRSCTDVGGVASLGSVCSSNRKGSAVTCHYSSNLNYIITNVMAHEVGHQFSAHHTFNNCNGNESLGSAYEPGGGTTIMAYCGLCGSNNVDYSCLENFHAHSVEQVRNFTRVGSGNSCATVLSTGNTAPIVELDYKDGFNIPIGTPFKLEGSAYDCEGDNLTYSWEEWDIGPISVPIGDPLFNTPIFTAMEPVSVPYRYFPAMQKIVNGTSDNSEILPTYSRALKFRLIARDDNPDGGGSDWANVSFRAEESAGPFYIIYPSQFASLEIGEEIEVEWNIANTDNEIINCKKVNIWLSTDAGYNYDVLLKQNTPNDGIESVVIPNKPNALVRFMVEAADNIFFDISNLNSKIQEPLEAGFYMEASPIYQQVCLPDIIDININTASFHGYNDTLRFETGNGLPEGAIVSFIPENVIPGENVQMSIDLSNVNKREFYTVEILSISSSEDTITRKIELDVITNDYSDIEIIQPLPGASGQGQLVDLVWTESQSADSYNVYLSTDPSFPESSTMFDLNFQGTTFTPDNTLQKSTVYYWKIEGNNECGSRDASEIITFATEAFSCKTFASDDLPEDIRSNKTTTSVITINEDTDVADININKIAGDHDNFNDLQGILVGPDGTQIGLFASKCYGYNAIEFDFGMDDESTNKFKCPPYGGVYYPSGSLSDLIGKSAKGDWKLEITDIMSPKGGELSNFEIEICANSVLSNPYLINNLSYEVAIGINWKLPTSRLRAADDDNLPEELTYTIIDMPQSANILKDGFEMQTGDQFSEMDIRNDLMHFFSMGEHGQEDSFTFVITDGNGGWLEKTRFNFVHDQFVDIEDIPLIEQVKVYPNPSFNIINVQIAERNEFKVEIHDIQGKKHWTGLHSGGGRLEIDLEQFASGFYFLKISNEKKNAVVKVVKQ